MWALLSTPVVDDHDSTSRCLRKERSEIDRLHLWEDYPGVTWVEIYVNQPLLIAQIGPITGTPTNGQIVLTLNGRPITVETAFANDADDVTAALKDGIRRANFDVVSVAPYIEVRWDNVFNTGITRVGFQSTDPGIVQSDVALEPQARDDDLILGGP